MPRAPREETGRDVAAERVARSLIQVIPLLHHRIISRVKEISGMQIAGFKVLGVLVRQGTLPISEVGKKLYISKPYMTRLVDDLIAENLVERLPDPGDRRVIRLRVTPKGVQKLTEMGDLFKDDVKLLIATLPDDDVRILDESLGNLTRIIEGIENPDHPLYADRS